MKIELLNVKIWNIILKLQYSAIGRKVVAIIYASGIVNVWNFLLYERERKSPTPEMIDSKKFFAENEARIQHAEDLLEDQTSKDIYRRCIQYRITHDWRERPHYNRKDQYFPKGIVCLSVQEVFIDCGAYNGDTIDAFLKRVHGQYKRIVAFEPDKKI